MTTDDELAEAIREARLEATAALLLAGGLLAALAAVSRVAPWSLLGLPWWTWLVLAAPEGVLVVAFAAWSRADLTPGRPRRLGVALLALLVAAHLAALAIVVTALVRGETLSGPELLLTGLVVWLTNTIVFGLLFWELDAGGPLRRARHGRARPDFQFPQDENPELAPAGWRPHLADYLYLALTNGVAFSPTDAMPLTRPAKGLMAAGSLISVVAILLVAARAVNVLGR